MERGLTLISSTQHNSSSRQWKILKKIEDGEFVLPYLISNKRQDAISFLQHFYYTSSIQRHIFDKMPINTTYNLQVNQRFNFKCSNSVKTIMLSNVCGYIISTNIPLTNKFIKIYRKYSNTIISWHSNKHQCSRFKGIYDYINVMPCYFFILLW